MYIQVCGLLLTEHVAFLIWGGLRLIPGEGREIREERREGVGQRVDQEEEEEEEEEERRRRRKRTRIWRMRRRVEEKEEEEEHE